MSFPKRQARTCSSFKHMRNWLKCQKMDLRARPGRLPTPVQPVLSTKTKLLLLSSFTLKLWTHLHVHLASISKQPAFPKSILQLPIYNLKQQLLTQSYYSSWNCVRCCSVSTCQIAAVQLTLLPPPIRIQLHVSLLLKGPPYIPHVKSAGLQLSKLGGALPKQQARRSYLLGLLRRPCCSFQHMQNCRLAAKTSIQIWRIHAAWSK